MIRATGTNNTLQVTFDPLPTFDSAKASIASNAPERGRLTTAVVTGADGVLANATGSSGSNLDEYRPQSEAGTGAIQLKVALCNKG